MNSYEENNILKVNVKRKNLKSKDIVINEIKNEDNFKTKNIKNKRIKSKYSMSNEIHPFPSEEELFHKNRIKKKDEENIKTIDFFQNKELSEDKKDDSNNINSYNNKINEKEYKGFLGRILEWLNYFFHEIPLLWKKEELVQGYDANGNIVMRPKEKIPIKHRNTNYIVKNNVENETNTASLDYTTEGINYGILFNKTY